MTATTVFATIVEISVTTVGMAIETVTVTTVEGIVTERGTGTGHGRFTVMGCVIETEMV